ncbi:HlyD family type I secretion periplasmic adaptor subunit [Candidatus Jidaibacter acanthamoebae]|nr:HlyD family type I secretion periplasmic adaptor subunit [Candidatus Jidaibacter acanthamoeba]
MRKNIISKLISFKGFVPAAKKLYEEINSFMKGATPEEAKYIMQHSLDLKKQIYKPIKFTFMVIGVAFGFFIVWGSLAPLDSAVIAPGHIVLSGNRKTIQHKEGGIIQAILVKDGEVVKENQPLVILNDTSDKARLQISLSRLRATKAIEQRLLAEKFDEEKIDFSDPIFDREVPEVEKIIKNQQSLFESKRKAYHGKKDIYNQKIVEQREQIKGSEAMLKSYESQHKILQEQYKNLETLFNKGYAKKTELLEQRRRVQELEGRVGQIKADIANAHEAISENQLHIISLENENQKEVDDELKETYSKILDLKEQYEADKDILERTVIKAPNAGIVTGLKFHTVGGVVGQGAPILEIIPQDDKLIVEAQVDPKDIESIREGLKAKVQLSAYKTRLVPRIDGEVIYVSADTVEDRSKQPPFYYVAKIEIKPEAIESINYDIKLQPGMPAETFIIKGERTFLQYLLSPILDSFHKAFKEK